KANSAAPEKAAVKTPAKTPAIKKPAAKAKAAAPAAEAATAKAASLAQMPEPKLWVKSYPEGVPAEIGPLPYENINALFATAYK
ncbi:acyl-CoA synthetase, partial [Escherichia coli]|nr:acyl-CoA synthetase [Escherichia coli]